MLPGISMSRPLLTDATVEWVAPQSDVTKPVKPRSPLRTPFCSGPFSQANGPLIAEYEHITESAWPCWTAVSNAGR